MGQRTTTEQPDRVFAAGAVQTAARRALDHLAHAEELTVKALIDLAVVDDAAMAELWGYPSTERLVAHLAGMTNRTSHELVLVARHINRHPATGEALGEGKISLAQTIELARAARGFDDAYRDHEDQLVGACIGRDAGVVGALARQWRDRRDDDKAAEDAEWRFDARGLWAQLCFDGACKGRFQLDPVAAQVFLDAIETLPDPADSLHEQRSLPQRRADALIDICHQSLHPDDHDYNEYDHSDIGESTSHPSTYRGDGKDHSRNDGDDSYSTDGQPDSSDASTSDVHPDDDPVGTSQPANTGRADGTSHPETTGGNDRTSDHATNVGPSSDVGSDSDVGPSGDLGADAGSDSTSDSDGGADRDSGRVAGSGAWSVPVRRPARRLGGPPVAADVVIDLETLANSDVTAVERIRSELAAGGPIAGPGLDRLLCDASFRAVITDGPNRILAYNDSTAAIAPSLRRAIKTRDRRCQFPGCDRSHRWCDIHHIIPRTRHGTNDPENLTLLCRFHHGLVHEGGWQLTRAPDHTITARSP